MSERPDQWYQDALDRKRRNQMIAVSVAYFLPRVLGLVAVIALVVIAYKL